MMLRLQRKCSMPLHICIRKNGIQVTVKGQGNRQTEQSPNKANGKNQVFSKKQPETGLFTFSHLMCR